MGVNPYVLKTDLCHYFDTEDGDEGNIHRIGITTCTNCGIPICSSCVTDGMCLECDDIRGDDQALLMRAFEMEDRYKMVRKFESNK